MKTYEKLRFCMISVLIVLSACSVDKNNKNSEIHADTLVFASNPEPVDGKLDVYTTMARASKYNVDVATQSLKKKIYNQNPNLNPQEMIENIISSDINDQSRLFAASRVLEYATIYAVASLENNSQFMDNYLYEKSAQHLASAAIRVHQDAWFASRKSKEVARLIRSEKKKSDELKKKYDRKGSLNSEELEYKKNLDVALMKFGEFQQAFAMNMSEYEQITKVLPKEIKLEGRRFYELEDFDKDYTIEVFQEAAVRNRKEFALAKDKVKNYGIIELWHRVLRDYPLVKRLDVNGLKVENDVYERALYDKVIAIAEKLLQDIRDFRLAKSGSDAQKTMQRVVFDDLAAAILTQVEVSYRLVEQANADYEANEREIAKIQKLVHKFGKSYRLTTDEKAELLNNKIMLVVLEQKSAQIKAERAMALRNLYFNAGLSPFSKTLLRGNIKDITLSLREAFNHDLVEMLSTVSMQMKEQPLLEQSGWAQGENWLEEVMKENKNYRIKPNRKAKTEKDNAKSLQFGAYENRDSAVEDWTVLGSKFPSLQKYQPQIEEAWVNGKKWYRLRIYDTSVSLLTICKEVRENGFECLLQ